MRACLVVFLVLVSMTDGVLAREIQEPLQKWWTTMRQLLDVMGAARGTHAPPPVEVDWRARLIWEDKIHGQAVDMVAGDVNGNGKSEVLILTTEAILLISQSRGLFDIRAQAVLSSIPASRRSRDEIGSISVNREGADTRIRVRSSTKNAGFSYRYTEGELLPLAEFAGYPLCHRGTIFAAPGRNYFLGTSAQFPAHQNRPLAAALYSVRCSRGEIDPSGRPVEYLSEVSLAGTLRIHCKGDPDFCRATERTYDDVGTAHAVTDVNGDGYPEVITSGTGVDGSKDRLAVYSQDPNQQRLVYEEEVPGGIVAIASGDFDGDRAREAVIMSRERGTQRMALWLVN